MGKVHYNPLLSRSNLLLLSLLATMLALSQAIDPTQNSTMWKLRTALRFPAEWTETDPCLWNSARGSVSCVGEYVNSISVTADLSTDLSNMGTLPTEVGLLSALVTLEVTDFQLTGPIPTSVVDLTNLRSLDLSGNKFTGSVPREFGLMLDIGVVNLSNNHLTGTIHPAIPWAFSKPLSLTYHTTN